MSGYRIITRAEWGANPKKRGDRSTVPEPWGEVVGHTEAGPVRYPASLAHETAVVKGIERFHTNPEPAGRGWQAIAYSFLIAPSGRIFEGRGWGYKGAHTEGRNSNAVAFCFLGHGDKQPLTAEAIAAAQWLIGEGIRLGHLTPNPRIGTHAEYSQKGKTCPGVLVVPQLAALRGIAGPTQTPDPIEDDMTPDQHKMLEQLVKDVAEIKASIGDAKDGTLVTLRRHLIDGPDPKPNTPRDQMTWPQRVIESLRRIEAKP